MSVNCRLTFDRGAWWAAVRGVAKSWTRLRDFTLTFHFHALEKEMATHSSVLAWRIPGMGEPGGLPSLGSHRVGHDWSDLAAAAAAAVRLYKLFKYENILSTSFLAYLWLLYWGRVYEGKRSWREKNDIEAIASSHLLSAFLRSSLYLSKKKLGEKYQNLVWWSLKSLFLLQAEMTQNVRAWSFLKKLLPTYSENLGTKRREWRTMCPWA